MPDTSFSPTLYAVGIVSTGIYIPSKQISNDALATSVENYDPIQGKGSLDAWIRRRYGIEKRHHSTPEELPSYQGAQAAFQALKRANLQASDIDFLILNTSFGDYAQPTTATAVQHLLGMRPDSFALELNMPCSGPIFGISIARNFLATGQYRYGLVVGVDRMTSLVDQTDFKMAGLFGEGAGACILGRCNSGGIQAVHLGSQGEVGQESDYALYIPAGKAKQPASLESVRGKRHFLHMNGKKVEAFVYRCFKESIHALLKKSGQTPKDIAYVVPHQAAKKLILNGLLPLGFTQEQILFSVAEYGNTSSASILITLDKLTHSPPPSCSSVILVGMGGGLNWGGILYEWTQDFV